VKTPFDVINFKSIFAGLGIHFWGIESIPRNAYTYIEKDEDM
jgi:hypothetical protein